MLVDLVLDLAVFCLTLWKFSEGNFFAFLFHEIVLLIQLVREPQVIYRLVTNSHIWCNI